MPSPTETWSVRSFLLDLGVHERNVDAVAKRLTDNCYNTKKIFLAAKRESLAGLGISSGVIDLIVDYQEQQRQQQRQQQQQQQQIAPAVVFEIQDINEIHSEIVSGRHEPNTIQIGWRREKAEYSSIRIFLRPYLSQLEQALDNFMGNDRLRHMYISGPPGSGKTTYCLFYFTLYMTKNADKKGLIIQYRAESEQFNEVMIVQGRQIRRVTKGTDNTTISSLVTSLIEQEGKDAFDFIVFDGVHQTEETCKSIGSAIVDNVGRRPKLIKITSLEFDIKGGDSTGGIDGYDEFFIASSWEYEEYEAAVNEGLLDADKLEKILCVDSDYKQETDTEEVDVKMEDAENKSQEEGGVQSEAENGATKHMAWLKSLLPRKFYYAGGSARFMFEYSIDQLTVSTSDEQSIFDRICSRMTSDDWEDYARLTISAYTSFSVSLGMQRIGGQYLPVSEYLLYLAHQHCKAKLTKSVRAAAQSSNNLALKGWAFELEQLDITKQVKQP